MAVSNNQDARLERRLRLALRLVLYPLAIGLIVLAWQRTHPKTAAFVPTPQAQPTQGQPLVERWVGGTGQGQPVRAVTVDGVLTFLETRIVTHCLDGSPWTLRLTMFASEFRRTGDIVNGRQGPALTTSDQGEPVRVATRVRTKMYHNPVGTILSKVTRSPGPRSVLCSSGELDYTLSREPVICNGEPPRGSDLRMLRPTATARPDCPPGR
jgi:hypothetical protein